VNRSTRRAGLGELAQQGVDLALGADVDAARGVEAQHRREAGGQPAGERELLLVAAGQPPCLALARVSIDSASIAFCTRRVSSRRLIGPSA
jgi:hypothetical protein